jgi:hypothetical protein
LSLTTFAIAAPPELEKEPAGVVMMLTVCADAEPISHGAIMKPATVLSNFTIVLPKIMPRAAGLSLYFG